MTVSFSETVRGVECEIFADDFDGDESTGVGYGPETAWATRLDNGEPLELTDKETEAFGIKATEIELESFDDGGPW